MRLAVINKEKCKPTLCAHECKKFCPVEKKEPDSCIVIENKAKIDEKTCIGCKICVKRCPFDAIDIINLPSVSESDIIHRYGENGFALCGLPTPKEGNILGLLGRNGIGKSTAISLLSGQLSMNLGSPNPNTSDIKTRLKGNELIRYFEQLSSKKIAYKPQNLNQLFVPLKVHTLLEKRGNKKAIETNAAKLGITHILDNPLNTLSGGELQRVAILATCISPADIYFFDEPLAYLDIQERIRTSNFIKEIARSATVIIVEHDLLLLDYLADTINIFFGSNGSYGTVSSVKQARYGINSYLEGFLKEENVRIRDKKLRFDFTKNTLLGGTRIATWPAFDIQFKEGFSLHTPAGEIRQKNTIGILGKNGTGKTSFVKALAGKIETTNGKLALDLAISYKPQHLKTGETATVKEIIFKEKITKKMIVTFNLSPLEQKKVSQLSGGELQRLELARCLSKEADLYLIDEPSAYLDVEERVSVAKAIKEMMIEKEKTAFVIDHDLLLISYVADAIINFEGEPGIKARASHVRNFEEGITILLKSLNVTLRKDAETGRPRINKKDSVMDREQKERGEWVVL